MPPHMFGESPDFLQDFFVKPSLNDDTEERFKYRMMAQQPHKQETVKKWKKCILYFKNVFWERIDQQILAGKDSNEQFLIKIYFWSNHWFSLSQIRDVRPAPQKLANLRGGAKFIWILWKCESTTPSLSIPYKTTFYFSMLIVIGKCISDCQGGTNTILVFCQYYD